MRALLVAVLVVALGGAVPVFGAEQELTPDDVQAADAARRAAARSLDAIAARYEEAFQAEQGARRQIAALTAEMVTSQQRLARLREEARRVVTDMYMDGGRRDFTVVFGAGSFLDIPVRSSYLEVVEAHELGVLTDLQSEESARRARQRALDEELDRRRRLVERLDALGTELTTKLDAAEAHYRDVVARFDRQEAERRRREEAARRAAERKRREEAARRAAARRAATTTTTRAPTTTTTTTTVATPPPVTSTTTTTVATPATTTTTTTPPAGTDGVARVCPVDGPVTFSDTWGAPRSGGRKHKGVDMIAARGTPLVAVEAGTIARLSNSRLGGISIYLTGDSGSRYYYAHLHAWADGLHAGMRVELGQLVGSVGSTGNASYNLPHLHFQYAPPGGDWVNPYPLVDGLCR